MKRISLLIVFLFLLVSTAHAAPCSQFVVPYNTASTISFCLQTYDSTATNDNEKLTLKNNATFSAGDIKVNLDHAGEANIGTLPTDRGTCYDMPLSTTETLGKEGYVTIIDQTSPAVWTATCIEYRTSGNASAFYASPSVNVTQWNGTAVPTPDTAGYPKVTIKDGTGTGEIDTNAGAVVAVTTAATCSALGATAKSDVNAEVVDVIRTDTGSELSACPTAGATLQQKIDYLFEFFRHKMTTDSSGSPEVQTLYKDNGTTPLCTNNISDASSIFTRGEFN